MTCFNDTTSRPMWYMLVGFCLFLLQGCSESVDERGSRVGARGTILMDGAVLEAGRIFFVSSGSHGTVKASALVNFGQFVFEPPHGPLPGIARVEIYPESLGLEEFERLRQEHPTTAVPHIKVAIPDNYNVNSILKANVSSVSTDNVFDFDLTSN